MKCFTSRAFALALFAVAVRATPTKIESRSDRVARRDAAITESPYVAQIRNVDGSLLCSGAILNFVYILTTASCVQNYEASDLTIVVGTTNFEDGTSYSVSRIVIHEEYEDGRNDIAMLKLASYLRYSTSVRACSIREPWEEEDLEDGSSAVVVGWGDFTTLRITSQSLITVGECNEAYSDLGRTISDDNICARTNPAEGSQQSSDLGSPLVQASTLIGLKSSSTSGHPDVYTRMHPYLLWIEENNLD